MPELPEVETIRRGLNDFIIREKLTDTDILCEKSFKGDPTTGTVTDIRRFGKAIVIDLDNDKSLLIHLRMTGQLIFDSNKAIVQSAGPLQTRYAAGHPSENFVATLPNKQTRVVLHLPREDIRIARIHQYFFQGQGGRVALRNLLSVAEPSVGINPVSAGDSVCLMDRVRTFRGTQIAAETLDGTGVYCF